MPVLKSNISGGLIAAGLLAGAVFIGGALQATHSFAAGMLQVGGTGAQLAAGGDLDRYKRLI